MDWWSGEIADAEQHFFVDAGADRSLRRFYWFQLESYLPGSQGSYDYSEDETRFIAGAPFAVNVRRYASPPQPASDRARAFAFLHPIYVEAAARSEEPTAEEVAAHVERAAAGLRLIATETQP